MLPLATQDQVLLAWRAVKAKYIGGVSQGVIQY